MTYLFMRYQRRRVPRRRPHQSRPERQLVDLGGVVRPPTRLPLGGGGVSYLEATAAVKLGSMFGPRSIAE
jgi:hypothetical protein